MQSIGKSAGAGAIVSLCLLSACASSELHAVNRAASLNVTSLALTAPVYTASRTPAIDARSRDFVNARIPAPAPRDVRAANHDEVQDQARTEILQEHADLLTAYFTLLANYSTPGTNSATQGADTQLAGASGLVDGITKLTPTLGQVATPALSLGLSQAAGASLRDNLSAYGPSVAEGLWVQLAAMERIEQDLRQNRTHVCDAGVEAFNNRPLPHRDGQNRVAADAAQEFVEQRRTALTCSRYAPEARSAVIALRQSRAAFVAVLREMGIATAEHGDEDNAYEQTRTRALADAAADSTSASGGRTTH